MLTQREEYEYRLLTLLAGSDQPMGSVTLSLSLDEQNLEISSATVGRLLSEFDRKGYTVKHGYRGRLLTPAGTARLADLRSRQALAQFSSLLHKTVDIESKDNLIDVLTARRGIEREIARLAAINATEDDIQLIRNTYGLQAEDAAKGKLSPEYDVAFHQSIAKASKNKVLAAAYDFIWQNGNFSPVMEYIRSYVGGSIASDHGKIVEAIAARNSEEAEQCMVRHIESLIEDVNRYWALAQEKK